MAAVREGRVIDLEGVYGFCRRAIAAPDPSPLLIEGVGGVMSPIAERATNLDWMRALGCPVLLVTGSYLGAISHALTAIEVVRGAGLSLAAVVVSESADSAPFDETLASLARLSNLCILGARRDQADEAWTGTALSILDARRRGEAGKSAADRLRRL
jgi:dethiobiotin synthetase